jgi:DNA adenine methylase
MSAEKMNRQDAKNAKDIRLIKWIGSKRRMARKIIAQLPEHTCYVEIFGGGALLLAKAPSKTEVYNDINGDLVNLFRVVKYHADALLYELDWQVRSRSLFTDYLRQPGLTDIQRAARFLLVIQWSFGANGGTFGTSCGSTPGSLEAKLESIRNVHQRLDKVQIENLDWRDCIDKYDRPYTCFFADPPYINGLGYPGAKFGEADHRELADKLKRAAGEWVLTYDDCELVRELYQGFCMVPVDEKRGIYGKGPCQRNHAQLIIKSHE